MKLRIPFLIRLKVYIDRARMYIGYAQFVMIAVVFLNSFKGSFATYCSHHPILTTGVGIVLFLVGSVIIGRLDLKLGLFEEEARRHSMLNPIQRDMLDKLDEIIKLLKK